MSASRTPRRRPLLLAGATAIAAVILLGLAGVAYMFSGSAPAAVSLASGVPPSAGIVSNPPPSAVASAGSPASAIGTASPSGATASYDGTWAVDTSIGSFSDFSSSFVGYRVAENLANVGSTTAVGRTPKVSGSLMLQGSSVTAATVTADLTALQSDKPMRDGQLQRQGLETDQFPTATFQLTTPIQLPSAPAEGATWSVTAQGRLTLHGVTKDVAIPLQAKLAGGVVTVVGSLDIAFADYGMTPPRSMAVLSVADHGTLELQLHFSRP